MDQAPVVHHFVGEQSRSIHTETKDLSDLLIQI